MTSNKKNGNAVMTILFLFISICSILGTIAFVMNFTSPPCATSTPTGSENYIEQLENAKEQLREISSKENYAPTKKSKWLDRITKKLNDPSVTSKEKLKIISRIENQALVEIARKMKAIEGMQPQINDIERRLGIMQSVEPVLENAIKTLQKVVDVRGMG